MDVRVKRIYDDVADDDGRRVLVDRVWPRGRTKAHLRLDEWARDLAPSTELRTWFGHEAARWPEFQARYHAELTDQGRSRALEELSERARDGRLTLVFGAHDLEHNQARVIADEIQRRLRGASS